jgi:uncharacterized protein (TIGR03084 family)
LIASLVDDLAAEAGELLAVLETLPEDAWRTPTPAVGWTVHDQVAHLAHFDWVTRLAVAEPQRFVALRDRLEDLQVYVDSIGPANASRDGADTAMWWRHQNDALRGAFMSADPSERVPWFGPPMSLASKVTARIMETWAHGQDVTDALGLARTPTDRLRHVARIGVLALPHSFRLNHLQVPEEPVRVQLVSPSGAIWEWGPDDAADSVTGDALDFCLLVTQRRHVADTSLQVTGTVARAWTQIAQAFAGAPGLGRAPGQFTTETLPSSEHAATQEVS